MGYEGEKEEAGEDEEEEPNSLPKEEEPAEKEKQICIIYIYGKVTPTPKERKIIKTGFLIPPNPNRSTYLDYGNPDSSILLIDRRSSFIYYWSPASKHGPHE